MLPIFVFCVFVCKRAIVHTFNYGHTAEISQCKRGQTTTMDREPLIARKSHRGLGMRVHKRSNHGFT